MLSAALENKAGFAEERAVLEQSDAVMRNSVKEERTS